ncbi:MAG: 1-(5-phosphoribosyl)-5-[(5-phosphoribosylamino)methylideneamino]imidazole-4-carboxamide isomerase [Acidobacteriota bacterium]|nr:1-(5-phosphoribosyl)-5-[(5-phosphoribosylamino)methylideneamino]imidazole-4-carboxamide isomerase [Acidobacteriota bacterium]
MLVIPAIDLVDGKCVRLVRGEFHRQKVYSGDPVDQALEFQEAGLTRIHVVDLEGARFGEGRNRNSIRRILSRVRATVQIGGGIREEADVSQLLDWGAGHLILGTSVLETPERVEGWISKWGPSPFIVSVDLRRGRLQAQGWERESSLALEAVLRRILDWGIEQIICTDVEQDGMLKRPGYAACRTILGLLPAHVLLVAAGGVTTPGHLSRLDGMGVGGAIIGRAFYEGKISLEEMARVG